MRWSLFTIFLTAALAGPGVRLAAATPALLWSDEFNQAANTPPDSTKWVFETGGGGWGNNELETYTSLLANSYVTSDPNASDGKALVIQAVKDSGGNYTSARLKTLGKFSTTYGHVEARLKTTSGKGLWPAFWMLGSDIATGTNWPACGEIDIMEVIGASPKIGYQTLHGPQGAGDYNGGVGIGASYTLPNNASYDTAYHVFSVDWSPNLITLYVDGNMTQSVTPAQLPANSTWVFNNSPFFILLNLAVGGNWPGTPDGTTAFPAKYMIDYVRVYGLPSTAPTGGGASAISASQVNLSWAAPPDLKGFTLTGYLIERATDSGFTTNLVQSTVGIVTSFSDTSVAGGTTYYYRVSAITTGGTSDPTPAIPVTTPPTATAAGFTADFNGDGKADILWSNTSSGDRYIWLMNGGAVVSSIFLGTISPQWVATAGDFNGDGKADILWSNTANGDRYVWLMNGGSVSGSVFLGTIATQWTATTGDFNGDGKADILWSNTSSGDRYLWLMNGGAVASSIFLGTIAPGWTPAIGDFNGDGKADILWSNTSNGDRYLWLMNGGTVASSIFLGTIAPQWTATPGDFSGDGKTDILWSNTSNGDRYLWLMNGGTVTTSIFLGTIAPQWTAPTGDFNGDGKADLLWSNASNGDRYLWLMNGGTVTSSIFLGTVAVQWTIGN